MNDYIIETHNLTKKYGSQTSVSHLNIHVKKGRIYGLLGRNGAGKTTLFKMIMGMESIDKGTFEVGETVQVGYADQTHKDIARTDGSHVWRGNDIWKALSGQRKEYPAPYRLSD